MMRKEIEIKDKMDAQQLIKVRRFDQSKHHTTAHKHNGYLELVFLTETSGKHYIDGREILVKAPCVLVIQQGNVHHWELALPVVGYVVLVKKPFVDQSLDFEINRLVKEVGKYNTVYLKDGQYLQRLLEMLQEEKNMVCQEGLFKVILAKTLEDAQKIKPSITMQNSLFVRFCALLSEDGKVINHVAYYAEILHTSPQNLNMACKKNTDLTASEVIATYIVKEAQRLLVYTGKTVSEVAYTLGFSDKSHFSKYFKRYAGTTPKNFRNQRI
ncbi:helix-turn-helix domain-containing protein [Sphingobacterium haloxyli]|uniref:AraC family transcriptional regulator n=1 Tax=Sphingobacterium haloxyli TaxID=2100533 RepID=A0A2S9J7W0_9SPHI|nr:helix-turn-helix transcriptional regulator [Sphingobacterium haloxyli]PRD48819.1 AraC family transcriptional regulator [Sphingobacterium haloxyli]